MQNYTDSFDDIPAENTVIIILALFNISDGLPQVQDSVLDFKPDMNVSRIIHQLFERQKRGKNIILRFLNQQ